VKYPDWSVTKLRDAKLGVFWLALLWIFLPSVTKPKMTLDKEKISVCAWFYSFLRINKTVAFFRLFKLLLHTRAQFFLLQLNQLSISLSILSSTYLFTYLFPRQ
jgi:hypothetical protein